MTPVLTLFRPRAPCHENLFSRYEPQHSGRSTRASRVSQVLLYSRQSPTSSPSLHSTPDSLLSKQNNDTINSSPSPLPQARRKREKVPIEYRISPDCRKVGKWKARRKRARKELFFKKSTRAYFFSSKKTTFFRVLLFFCLVYFRRKLAECTTVVNRG